MSMPITMLNGLAGRTTLGCACDAPPSVLGAVADYDIITIGGKQYSANQVVDKQIVASKDVTLYPSLFKEDGKFTVKAGQTIGTVFSYLLPSAKSNPTGRVVLQFERGYNQYYWLKDDRAVSTVALKDQGSLTLTDERKAEAEKLEKENDAVGYYLKKYGLPVLLIGGGIYLAATYGKAFITAKLSKA